ncbi:hypothetical protein I7X12_03620 [Halosimplex litoreum]|uniref:CHAT domain-containing protein n=1 Tax=Halosimplex litoreum TaxID=1198301 RepID=A0A7T3KVX4_9EURY|nr:hypothetical protein [Halosimplex litoreum]QPV63732.1 hypothetical protein I7X12_03620 [Halosimplex litoreum]
MSDREDDADPRFEATTDPTGVRIVDPIEAVDFEIGTDRPVEPTPADPGTFDVPVDTAATIETTEVRFPYHVGVVVRTRDGEQVAEVFSADEREVPTGRYTLELSTTAVKLYFHAEGPLSIQTYDDRARVDFESRTRVRIGARSYHESPAATIATTADPADLAAAISLFGSALKTTSPERSWPTLRGYPPLVEVGDRLHAPDALSSPDTGVSITIRPRLADCFAVAPLAFYLGATVEIGEDPSLRADGREWSLTTAGDLPATATDVLQRQFTLDCVVRTAGRFDIDLAERTAVESRLPFDIEAMYEADLQSRTAEFMDVSRERLADAIPRWKLTADVVPSVDRLDALPHLAAELAAVRCPDAAMLNDPEPGNRDRRSGWSRRRWTSAGADTQTGSMRSAGEAWNERLVYPPRCSSVEHAFLGDGVPVGTSKMTASAYERKLDRERSDETRIDITVVGPGDRTGEDGTVADIYSREGLESFDTTVVADPSTVELQAALARDTDFLHYVGHVDDRGIECADGFVDVRTVDDVGAELFFLNGCTSFAQGRALVDEGAAGGIVTVADIFDSVATRVGESLARLLGQGYSLCSALRVLGAATVFPAEIYTVVGDGSVSVTTNESVVPIGYRLSWDDGLVVAPFCFPTEKAPLGTVTVPFSTDNGRHVIASGDGTRIETTVDAFVDTLDTEPYPVFIDDELHWSPDLTREDIEAWVETVRERA